MTILGKQHSVSCINLLGHLNRPMCYLMLSEQVSLSPLMKLTEAQWAADMKYTWSAACNISKQTDKRSFWAAEVVYMLIMQPHCSLHTMVSVCLSQFWCNVCFKSLRWLPVCQKIDFKILLLVYKALNVLRIEHIWSTCTGIGRVI